MIKRIQKRPLNWLERGGEYMKNADLKEIKQSTGGKSYHWNKQTYSTSAIEIAKKIKDRKKSIAHAGRALYED